MRKKIVISFYFLAGIFALIDSSFAQVPGFIGKRNLMSIESAQSLSRHSNSSNGPGIISNFGLSIERVIGRKTSFFAFASYSPSKYNFGNFYFDTEGGESDVDRLTSFETADNYMKGYFAFAGAGLKFFRKEFISPVGRFFKLRMGYFRYGLQKWEDGISGTYYIRPANSTSNLSKSGSLKTTDSFYSGILLSFGFGKVIPITDNFMFELGNNINFTISQDYSFGNLDDHPSNNGNVNSFIFNTLYSKGHYRYLFDFYFGFKFNF
jgi:hypothetical protein